MSGDDAEIAWQAGGGVVDSLVTSAAGLRDGDWIEASLVGYCALAETAGALGDPLGTLVSAGVGWLMEHLAPLNALLDLVAGDPDAVRADAAIWSGVGDRLRETCALHDREVARAAQQWSGAAATAYVASSRSRRLLITACAEGADAVAGAHLLAGSLVAGVRQEVRQQVGEVVAWIVKRAPLLASGVATPALLLRLATRVREVCTRLQRLIDTTLDCVEALGGRLVDLTGDWQRLAGALSHLGAGARRLARAEEGGPRIAAGAVRWGLGQAGV